MPEDRPTDRKGAARAPGAGRGKRAPKLRFESVAPTRREVEEMAEGLGILAEWLLRRHRRLAQNNGENTSDRGKKTSKENLDFLAPPSPHVG